MRLTMQRLLYRFLGQSEDGLMVLSFDEDRLLHQMMTQTNLYRARLIAWMMTFIMSAVIIGDLLYYVEKINVARAVAMSPYVDYYLNGLRFSLVIIAIVFLLLTRKSINFNEIKPRHHGYLLIYLLSNLILLALVNGVLQVTELSIPSTYLIAVVVSSAFLYLKVEDFLIVYSLSGLVMMVGLLLFENDLGIATARIFNILITTIMAFILSRANFLSRMQEFINEQQIQRQKEELAQSNNMLLHLSYLDALTGIPNRRYYEEILNRDWKQSRRDNSPLSFMFIDIDKFKDYNDKYGHQAGDECLRQIAVALTKVLKRPGDLVARYGGEEFAVILPDTNLDASLMIGEKMMESVKELKITHPSSPSGITTVSIGISCTTGSDYAPLEKLILDADEALYKAKRLGRDRIEIRDNFSPAGIRLESPVTIQRRSYASTEPITRRD